MRGSPFLDKASPHSVGWAIASALGEQGLRGTDLPNADYDDPRMPAATNCSLVVTADDFGLAPEVNEAVEIAHRDGILSAASLMVSGAAPTMRFAEPRLPELAVGLHLALIDGRPTLPASRIPDLVGPDGTFRRTSPGSARHLLPPCRPAPGRGRDRGAVRGFSRTGLPLDHVNAHKHFICIRPRPAARGDRKRYGLRGLRVPVEPAAVAKVEPVRLGLEARLAAPLRACWRWGRDAPACVPDQVFGLAWTGAMTRTAMAGLLQPSAAGPHRNLHASGDPRRVCGSMRRDMAMRRNSPRSRHRRCAAALRESAGNYPAGGALPCAAVARRVSPSAPTR